MLEGLAAEVELGKAPSPTCLILAPARSSLCDPRFVSSCRGVHARIHERGASFVLELPVFATVPEPLRELLNQGIEIALRLSRPEQLSLSCLAEPGLRYIVVAGLPSAGPGDSRMLQALSAAAHALGIAIVFSAEFDTVLPIEADYRIGELKL